MQKNISDEIDTFPEISRNTAQRLNLSEKLPTLKGPEPEVVVVAASPLIWKPSVIPKGSYKMLAQTFNSTSVLPRPSYEQMGNTLFVYGQDDPFRAFLSVQKANLNNFTKSTLQPIFTSPSTFERTILSNFQSEDNKNSSWIGSRLSPSMIVSSIESPSPVNIISTPLLSSYETVTSTAKLKFESDIHDEKKSNGSIESDLLIKRMGVVDENIEFVSNISLEEEFVIQPIETTSAPSLGKLEYPIATTISSKTPDMDFVTASAMNSLKFEVDHPKAHHRIGKIPKIFEGYATRTVGSGKHNNKIIIKSYEEIPPPNVVTYEHRMPLPPPYPVNNVVDIAAEQFFQKIGALPSEDAVVEKVEEIVRERIEMKNREGLSKYQGVSAIVPESNIVGLLLFESIENDIQARTKVCKYESSSEHFYE